MREMVEDYSRQLEVRDQHIRRLEAACDGEVAMLAQKEVEVLKQENRMLRDKVAHMSDEIAHLGAGAASDANYRALQDEVDRLSQLLMEKDR
jgi:predicted RNase H-like nuclease (RuvC/YqgF family)